MKYIIFLLFLSNYAMADCLNSFSKDDFYKAIRISNGSGEQFTEPVNCIGSDCICIPINQKFEYMKLDIDNKTVLIDADKKSVYEANLAAQNQAELDQKKFEIKSIVQDALNSGEISVKAQASDANQVKGP